MDIRRLAALALPDVERKARESIACNHFLDALADPELALKIREWQPSTLDSALRIALQLEVWTTDTNRLKEATKPDRSDPRRVREISKPAEPSNETFQKEMERRFAELESQIAPSNSYGNRPQGGYGPNGYGNSSRYANPNSNWYANSNYQSNANLNSNSNSNANSSQYPSRSSNANLNQYPSIQVRVRMRTRIKTVIDAVTLCIELVNVRWRERTRKSQALIRGDLHLRNHSKMFDL